MNIKSRSREFEVLSNPPIVEAIFEIRWDVSIDRKTHITAEKFKFFPGKFNDKIKDSFPFLEILPNSNIPDDMNPYLVRYRFRKTKAGYPLVQIGPGVLTYNLNKDTFLSQKNFFEGIENILDILYQILGEISVNKLTVHYIDVFTSKEEPIFHFLREKLRISYNYDEELFTKTKMKAEPNSINSEVRFDVDNPKGEFVHRIRSGKNPQGENSIIVDSLFISKDKEIPAFSSISDWIIDADELIHEWFYTMIKNYKELW